MSKYDSDKFSDFFNNNSSKNREKVTTTNAPAPAPVKNAGKKNSQEAKIRKKLRNSKKLGIAMCIIQLILSVVFMVILYKVRANVLDSLITFEYYIGIGVAIFILLLIPFIMQFNRLSIKRTGKVISVIMIIVLSVGTYFMAPLNNLKLSGEGKKKVSEKPFAVYLSGTDSFDELSTSHNSRSDTNIVAVVNPETYTAVLISTPRDAYVEIIGEDVDAGTYDKLTHAGNYGSGKLNENGSWTYGCDVSMNVLSALYDVELDNYLKLNFTGFEKLVDALGGVTIDIPQGFSTYTYGKHYTFSEGTHTLNGEEALTYVRERHSFATGDIQRGANQVAVINAIVDQAMSANAIANYGDIVNAISSSFDTNLDISSLAKLQLSLQDNDDYSGWNIVSYSVSGTSYPTYQYCASAQKNLSVVDLDDEDVEIAKTLANKVINGEKVTKNTVKKLESATDDTLAQ